MRKSIMGFLFFAIWVWCSASNLEELLDFSTGAIALLGHSNQSLFQQYPDLMRPFLNKEYSALCSSHMPITGKLFGDEPTPQYQGFEQN